MQLRKNLNLYLSGIVVFMLTILLLSTAFALDENLGNRVAKIFWFYKVIIVAGVACIPLAWMRPFRFSITDLLVLLYAGYTLCNDYFAGSIAPTRTSLFILIIVTYFIFRRLTTFVPLGFTHAALLLTGAIEAIWGLAQLYGFTPSQHSRFELTGSFFNPGPYSGFLVAILPLALYYTLTACRIARILSGVILVLLLLVLPATLSRGAWLAAIAGCGIVLGNYFHLYKRLKFLFQKHRLASFIATICIFLLVTGTLIGIYQLKKESADGRRLIWKVSSTLVASHPATGVGFGHFAGAYGEAQAAYFSATERPAGEELVADAPETAFNEFVQIATETGIIGLLLFLTIIFWAFKTARHPDNKVTAGVTGSLAAFLVFACFSYPFSVLPLLVLFTLLLAQCTPIQRGSRWLSGIFYLFLLLPVYFLATGQQEREQAYKRWKSEQIYFNMQIFERTVDNYKKLYPLLKDQPAFLFEYGQCLSRTGQPEASNLILKEAARLSADPMIRNIMGKNYQTMKQYPQAESAFLKASHMVPNRLYPLYLLAKMYHESGQTDKAIATARLLLEKAPKVPSSATEEMKRDMQKLIRDTLHLTNYFKIECDNVEDKNTIEI